MVSVEYSEAITEVLDILNHMKKVDTDKISKKFKKFLVQNQSTSYHPQLDHTKAIKDMELKEKTKDILAIIYSNYWCNEDEKLAFEKLLQENEKKYQKELREKYNPNNIFKEKEIKTNNYNKEILTIEKKDTIITKIIKFIKGIFNKE